MVLCDVGSWSWRLDKLEVGVGNKEATQCVHGYCPLVCKLPGTDNSWVQPRYDISTTY